MVLPIIGNLLILKILPIDDSTFKMLNFKCVGYDTSKSKQYQTKNMFY